MTLNHYTHCHPTHSTAWNKMPSRRKAWSAMSRYDTQLQCREGLMESLGGGCHMLSTRTALLHVRLNREVRFHVLERYMWWVVSCIKSVHVVSKFCSHFPFRIHCPETQLAILKYRFFWLDRLTTWAMGCNRSEIEAEVYHLLASWYYTIQRNSLRPCFLICWIGIIIILS